MGRKGRGKRKLSPVKTPKSKVKRNNEVEPATASPSSCLICGVITTREDRIDEDGHGAACVDKAFKKISKYLLLKTTPPFSFPYVFCVACIPKVQTVIELNKKLDETEMTIMSKIHEIGEEIVESASGDTEQDKKTIYWTHFRRPIIKNFTDKKIPGGPYVRLEKSSEAEAKAKRLSKNSRRDIIDISSQLIDEDESGRQSKSNGNQYEEENDGDDRDSSASSDSEDLFTQIIIPPKKTKTTKTPKPEENAVTVPQKNKRRQTGNRELNGLKMDNNPNLFTPVIKIPQSIGKRKLDVDAEYRDDSSNATPISSASKKTPVSQQNGKRKLEEDKGSENRVSNKKLPLAGASGRRFSIPHQPFFKAPDPEPEVVVVDIDDDDNNYDLEEKKEILGCPVPSCTVEFTFTTSASSAQEKSLAFEQLVTHYFSKHLMLAAKLSKSNHSLKCKICESLFKVSLKDLKQAATDKEAGENLVKHYLLEHEGFKAKMEGKEKSVTVTAKSPKAPKDSPRSQSFSEEVERRAPKPKSKAKQRQSLPAEQSAKISNGSNPGPKKNVPITNFFSPTNSKNQTLARANDLDSESTTRSEQTTLTEESLIKVANRPGPKSTKPKHIVICLEPCVSGSNGDKKIDINEVEIPSSIPKVIPEVPIEERPKKSRPGPKSSKTAKPGPKSSKLPPATFNAPSSKVEVGQFNNSAPVEKEPQTISKPNPINNTLNSKPGPKSKKMQRRESESASNFERPGPKSKKIQTRQSESASNSEEPGPKSKKIQRRQSESASNSEGRAAAVTISTDYVLKMERPGPKSKKISAAATKRDKVTSDPSISNSQPSESSNGTNSEPPAPPQLENIIIIPTTAPILNKKQKPGPKSKKAKLANDSEVCFKPKESVPVPISFKFRPPVKIKTEKVDNVDDNVVTKEEPDDDVDNDGSESSSTSIPKIYIINPDKLVEKSETESNESQLVLVTPQEETRVFRCGQCGEPWTEGYEPFLEHLWEHKTDAEKEAAIKCPVATDIPKRLREELIVTGRAPDTFHFSEVLIAELILHGQFSQSQQQKALTAPGASPSAPKGPGDLTQFYTKEDDGLCCRHCSHKETLELSVDGDEDDFEGIRNAERSLIIHFLKSHFSRSFICNFCGQGFSQQGYLTRHVDLIHVANSGQGAIVPSS